MSVNYSRVVTIVQQIISSRIQLLEAQVSPLFYLFCLSSSCFPWHSIFRRHVVDVFLVFFAISSLLHAFSSFHNVKMKDDGVKGIGGQSWTALSQHNNKQKGPVHHAETGTLSQLANLDRLTFFRLASNVGRKETGSRMPAV